MNDLLKMNDRLIERLRRRDEEIERLQGFVAKVRDATEDIDPDVLPPNASAAMAAVQTALMEISDSVQSEEG